jgi:hypothetical protein
MSGWGSTFFESLEQLEENCNANLDSGVYSTFKALVNHCIFFGEQYKCAPGCENKKLFDSVMKCYSYARSPYGLEASSEAYHIMSEILQQPREKAMALMISLIGELIYKEWHHDAYLIFSAFANRISWRDDTDHGDRI